MTDTNRSFFLVGLRIETEIERIKTENIMISNENDNWRISIIILPLFRFICKP